MNVHRRIAIVGIVAFAALAALPVLVQIYFNTDQDYYKYRTQQKIQAIADICEVVPYSAIQHGDISNLTAFLRTLSDASGEQLDIFASDAFGQPLKYQLSIVGNETRIVISNERAGQDQNRLELIFTPPVDYRKPSVVIRKSW